MQPAVSFHNVRHGAERGEAQINAFRTHPAVKEKCPQPWTFRRSQPGGLALGRSRGRLCGSVELLLLFSLCLHFVAGCATQPEKANDRMKKDEQGVRQWFERWMKATKEGDLQLARSLIADDAIFLVPGAGRMDKESFAAAATATDPNVDFELDCSIQEIEILGDHAWLWTKMSLTVTDRRSNSRSLMAGHSLSILKRQGDGWVVIRDANTMVAVKQD